MSVGRDGTMKRIHMILTLAVATEIVAVGNNKIPPRALLAAMSLTVARPDLPQAARSRNRRRQPKRRAGNNVNGRDQFGRTRLMLAAGRNDLLAVKTLLAKGADVNTGTPDGYTPLMYAAFYGNGDIVKFLLEKGADVNARDKDGHTALMEAAKQNLDAGDVMADYVGTVKALLEKRADVSLRDKEGRTALINAEAYGLRNKGEIVRLLKEAEAKR